MDICFWKPELRSLHQTVDFIVILSLINVVGQKLETVIKGQGYRLLILLLDLKFLDEFSDTHNTDCA